MTINYGAVLKHMAEEREVLSDLELMHDACLKNMVTAHTGDPASMLKVANFIKHIVTGFSAPALFMDENVRKVESYIADDPAHMGMALTYAMQVFKYGRDTQISLIVEVMCQAWDVNCMGPTIVPAECANLIKSFPAALVAFMCMLFPNASIGMVNQIFTPPVRPESFAG